MKVVEKEEGLTCLGLERKEQDTLTMQMQDAASVDLRAFLSVLHLLLLFLLLLGWKAHHQTERESLS